MLPAVIFYLASLIENEIRSFSLISSIRGVSAVIFLSQG